MSLILPSLAKNIHPCQVIEINKDKNITANINNTSFQVMYGSLDFFSSSFNNLKYVFL